VRQNMPAGPESMQLLRSIAEQLKQPLTNIARHVELERLRPEATADLSALGIQTTVALTLVDSYLLGLQLAEEQGNLALEPVSVASTLTDTAHELQGLAKQYGVALEVHIKGRYEPVMAHHTGLKAALLSLGYALVEAEAAQAGASGRLVLAAHRNRYGIVAGLYGEQTTLRAEHWRTALALCGQARQPLTGMSTGSGAGLFVADTILQAMATRLRVGRHARRVGLSATLLPSQQLQLV